MQFIEVSGGRYYPVSAIERIVPLHGRQKLAYYTHRVVMTDGFEAEIAEQEISAIKRAGAQVIPAHPSYFLLTYLWEDDPKLPVWSDILREPILAWRVSEYGGLDPVTLDWNVTELTSHQAVLHPDGGVYTSERGWSSVAEWEAEQGRDAEAARAKLAAEAESKQAEEA